MHIPDGYLSPSTCAGLFAASSPFWYVAGQKIRRVLNTRTVPLLSVLSAFSFVVMMFNLPLPGGTTGHAVGMGLASILLGPWVSIVAISIALTIQAVFFGDGGITAIGANCFNMAIVGSIAAYFVYRLVSWRATIGSVRRFIAAGLAGYVGLNLSAFCAAIEFGIQPALFHDVSGAPLYCPYPLSISIPAMMIGHLTFAGLTEMVITAGVVAYFQRADPSLLRTTALDAPETADWDRSEPVTWPSMRKLWIALAALLVLTPLGIVAAGSAWGEWGPQDFVDPSVRAEIAAASGNHAPPAAVPKGLARLNELWDAPIARYAPSFIKSSSLGYFFSAMVGVGLIILIIVLFQMVTQNMRSRQRSSRVIHRSRFVERTVASLLSAMEEVLFAEDLSHVDGLLQHLDARAKVVGFLVLIVTALAVQRLTVLASLLLFAIVLALVSRIRLRTLALRAWLPVLGFTGLIALPAVFFTPGLALFHISGVPWPVTQQGIRSASFLLLRAETAATYTMLAILSTSWTGILRSLRFFHLPVPLVVILSMTFRYIFLLLQTAHHMFEARRARLIGVLEESDRQRLASGTVGVLLDKSLQLSSDVHQAMLARGYRGEVYLLNDLAMSPVDWGRLMVLLGVALLAFWWGR